jgi:hypothetical protein
VIKNRLDNYLTPPPKNGWLMDIIPNFTLGVSLEVYDFF